MMSQHSKKELSEAIRSRYLRARKSEKERILDEFVAATGYHRKYAIRILKHGPKPKGLKKKGRQKVYQGEVVQALTRVWEICGRICSKRLKPFLPEITSVLERHNELHLSAETKVLLLSIHMGFRPPNRVHCSKKLSQSVLTLPGRMKSPALSRLTWWPIVV